MQGLGFRRDLIFRTVFWGIFWCQYDKEPHATVVPLIQSPPLHPLDGLSGCAAGIATTLQEADSDVPSEAETPP